ncbi:MAG: hypothetical protein K2P59_00220, partial [Acetatifactor sp.]|nr:hypothetical protein [Acetatifactor sp.]
FIQIPSIQLLPETLLTACSSLRSSVSVLIGSFGGFRFEDAFILRLFLIPVLSYVQGVFFCHATGQYACHRTHNKTPCTIPRAWGEMIRGTTLLPPSV